MKIKGITLITGIVVFGIIFSISLIWLLPTAEAPPPETNITNNIGYYEDDWLKMTVSPYRDVHGQWDWGKPFNHTFVVENKKAQEGYFCLAYRFRDKIVSGDIQLEKEKIYNETKSYICNPPNFYNYSTVPKHFWCWENRSTDNVTYEVVLVFEHDFETYNLETNTAYWNETKTSYYFDDVTQYISHTIKNNKHFYYTNTPLKFDALATHKWKIGYTPNATDDTHKWDLVFWGTLEADCSCILDDTCLFVSNFDPEWWDTSWNYRKNIQIEAYYNQTDYELPINVTYDSDMVSDFSDLRFTNESNNETSYWIESKSDSNWAYVWVRVSQLNSTQNTTVYMYYGNTTEVSSESDPYLTFHFYDNLTDANFNSTKWWVANETTPLVELSEDDKNMYIQMPELAGGHMFVQSNDNFTFSGNISFEAIFLESTDDMTMDFCLAYPNGTEGTDPNCINSFDRSSVVVLVQSDIGTDYNRTQFEKSDGTIFTATSTNVVSVVPGSWYNFTMITDGQDFSRHIVNTSGESFYENTTANHLDLSTVGVYPVFHMYHPTDTVNPWLNISYVRVKGWADPSPVYSIGSEEAQNEAPDWSGNQTSVPANYDSTNSSWFNVTWTDDNDSNGYNFSYFEINITGTLTNYTTTRDGNISYYTNVLGVGTYNFSFYANDSSDEWNQTDYWTATISEATPTLSTSVTSPITYETASDYSGSESNQGDGGCSYVLERNSTQIDTGSSVSDTTVLGADAYNYTYYTAGCANYTSGSDEQTLTVNAKSVTVTLGGITGQTITYEASATPYCSYTGSTVETPNCILYRDDVDVTSTENNTAMTYGYKATAYVFWSNVSLSSNYSYSNQTDTLTVNQKDAGVQVSPSTQTIVYETSVAQYCSDSSSLLNCVLYRNGTEITNDTAETLGVDAYGYVANLSDDTNYTNYDATSALTVSKMNIDIGLAPTTQTITYPTSTTPYCTGNHSTYICSLWRNGINITETENNTVMIYGAGTEEFSANVSASTVNYSWTEQTSTLTVNQNTSTENWMNLTLNGTEINRTYTYPTASNATGWYSTVALGDQTITFTLYRNTTTVGTSNPIEDVNTYGNATYNYTYYTAGNTNYSSASKNYWLFINKGATLVDLYLNGTKNSDKFYKNDSVANITGVVNVTGLTINLGGNYTWDFSPSSGTTSIENITTLTNSSDRIFNITAYFTENENYTGSSRTKYIKLDVTLPFVYAFGLNDTYIHINESINLTVNASDTFDSSSNLDKVIAEVQTSGGSTNYTLQADGNYSYLLNKTWLGDLSANSTLVNITNIYANDSAGNLQTNSTTLQIDYARTNLVNITDSPDPVTNSAGQLADFTANYTTEEDSIITDATCEIDIFGFAYGMTYDSTDKRYEVSISTSGRAADVHTYNITCIQSSYQSQVNDTNTITVSESSPPAGGGGGGGYVSLCGNQICEVGETAINCPQDCLAVNETFSLHPEYYNIPLNRGGKIDLTAKIRNPNAYNISVKIEIGAVEEDPSFQWVGISEREVIVPAGTEKVLGEKAIRITGSVPVDATQAAYQFNLIFTSKDSQKLMPVKITVSEFIGAVSQVLRLVTEGEIVLPKPIFGVEKIPVSLIVGATILGFAVLAAVVFPSALVKRLWREIRKKKHVSY